jgi:putative glutamine amidotransferase
MKHPRYNEIMDCLDIRWVELLTSIDILPVPLPLAPASSADDIWKALELDGLILSGGNTLVEYADATDNPESLSPERDAYENALLKAALSTGKPLLGVCRGLQVINTYYSGQLAKIKGHAGTRHRLVAENSSTAFQFPSEVNSFHDCAVPRKKLGKELIPLAHDAENNIEAFYHPKDKILGIMWHPEREHPPLQRDCEFIKRHFGL